MATELGQEGAQLPEHEKEVRFDKRLSEEESPLISLE